jgi:hypothetical protein
VDDGWVDASRGAVQQGRVRVLLTGVAVGPADLKAKSGKRPSRERYLVVRVRVSHVGGGGPFTFAGWGNPASADEKNLPRLTDSAGKAYARPALESGAEVDGQERDAPVFPGNSTDDVLLFAAPDAGVESLRLELPASACGGSGAYRLSVPKSMIRGLPARGDRPRDARKLTSN